MATPADHREDLGPEEDLSGRQLGDYRLLRRLGTGAMAVVYLAEQCSLNRQVAFKVLRGGLVDDETYVRRFQREAKAAAALVHANIVQIHEVGCVDRVYFIAQEYVEGQNLRSWINRNEKPPLAPILSVMCQVAAALAKAGSRGIVHRDIKPENILITRSGEVKVADFGLARLPNQGDPVELTQVGITLGTPLYMSPEQVEGKPLDPRSDLYSFGVTCYHMIVGSPPFSGETPLSVAVQHLKKEPERLDTLRTDLPRELCEAVHRMLAKDPKQRYQSARQLLQDLRRIQQERLGNQWPDNLPGWAEAGVDTVTVEPIQATQRLQVVMETTVVPSRASRRRLALAAAVACMFLTGAAAAWLLLGRSPLVTAQPDYAAVTREDTALQQYIKASRLDTPKAWQAVIDYFPVEQDRLHADRARQELIRIYLRKGDYAKALEISDALIQSALASRESRAFGQAGRVVALSGEKQYAASSDAYNSYGLWDDNLKDSHMRELLESAQKRNLQNLAGGGAPQ
jgi:eukaryotic-like serine/threonine-protein kinase